VARGGLGLVACAVFAAGCADKTDSAATCGAVERVAREVELQAVETGERHFAGVVTFAWLELVGACIAGGQAVESEADAPFPLLADPDGSGRWGTWHLFDASDTALELDYDDGGAGCVGSGCDPWPAGLADPVGPWLDAREFYFDAWTGHG
jgi:hypothetical protein